MSTPPGSSPLAAGHSAPVAFLKIAEIKGEGYARTHESEIGIQSWSWREQHSAATAGVSKERPKVEMGDLVFTAVTSIASPLLMQGCASGKRLKTVVLTVADTKGKSVVNYVKITFTDVVISSYQVAMSPGTSDPLDMASLSFRKIEFEYIGTKEDHSESGTMSGSWDLGQNTK